MTSSHTHRLPAKAGIQFHASFWTPASAGVRIALHTGPAQ